MSDILNQENILHLVDEFYKKLLSDNRINFIFTDVVKIKIEEHLPILVTFWSQMILGTGGYTNNLTDIHLKVDKLHHLTPAIFEIWMQHFNQTVDDNFSGSNANEIKNQAQNLSIILQIKIQKLALDFTLNPMSVRAPFLLILLLKLMRFQEHFD